MIPLIGGSALGCERATGVRPLFHLSYTPFAANESHLLAAWPEVPVYRLDRDTFPTANFPDIDFVNSVCPCAGLSMLNTQSSGQSGRGCGIQNEWMVKSARFVLEQVRPKVLWGENAPGLFLALGAAMVPRLRALAQQFGYSFSMVKTDTARHGLPQHRQRTFYFFWQSFTAPLLRWILKPCPDLLAFLYSIPAWAQYQDLYVQEGSVTERFKPYQYVLLRENLSHEQFSRKMAKENNGTITVSKYLDKYGLLDDCIGWMKHYYPEERWSVKTGRGAGRGRTIVDYLEHCKEKLSRGLGYWDDSPKFMGDVFTAVITKNVMFAVHPLEDRFLNIRELMHLMGLPHDFEVTDPKRNWNHICQSVPVDTAAAWAEQVMAFCRGELADSGSAFVKQDNIKQEVVAKEGTIKVEVKDELEEDVGPYVKVEQIEMKFEVKVELEDECVPNLPQGQFRTFEELARDFVPKTEPKLKKAKVKQEAGAEPLRRGQPGDRASLWEASGPKEEQAAGGLLEAAAEDDLEDQGAATLQEEPQRFQCNMCQSATFLSKTEVELHFPGCAKATSHRLHPASKRKAEEGAEGGLWRKAEAARCTACSQKFPLGAHMAHWMVDCPELKT